MNIVYLQGTHSHFLGIKMRCVSVWLSDMLFELLDDYVKDNGYSSKSELLRGLIREVVCGERVGGESVPLTDQASFLPTPPKKEKRKQ